MLDYLRGKTDEQRRRRRLRAAERACRPLVTQRDRIEAWASLMLVDHGVFRLLYRNRHRITDDVWRSAQPAPADIAWAARNGIRTVVTLRRGSDFGSHALAAEACERAGLALVRSPLFSRDPPHREVVEAFAAVIGRIEYPALIHCKSGADRAGLAAAMLLLIREGRPSEEALGQLSLRYGHVRWGKTGILDHFIETYAREGEANGLTFLDWVRTVYDRDAVLASFRSSRWADVLVDRVLRRE